MKKIGKMSELAWLVGTILCAFGVSLCTKADFGLSMLAAPPYIIHIAVSRVLPWYSQGTSEYVWQAFLFITMCLLIRKFKFKLLLSFVTGVFFGAVIDGWLLILGGGESYVTFIGRIAAFVIGELCISLSVAMVFRSYLPPQVPECLVIQVAKSLKIEQTKVKMINDIICLTLSFGLSLVLTRGFTGVGIGTIIVSVINAPIIKLWGKLLDKIFDFDPMIPKLEVWLK